MMSFDEALLSVCSDLKLAFTLKAEQQAAVQHIFNKKHTFCVLPTGFGKSMIYALPPLVMDKVCDILG
jgi:superfamily II DNA helicase RecQ